MDRSHLDWPFFADLHRALAADLGAWAATTLATDDHADVDARCRALVHALGAAGWLRYCVPAAHGGALEALDSRALCVARETLAWHDGLADFAFAMQGLGSGAITLAGTEAQQARWLPRVAQGTAIAAFALSEPDAGSDVAAMSTRAARDGDGWVLDGSKTFVTNAPVADVFVLYARTSPGFAGITSFLVPRGTPGLTVSAPIEKMGLRTSLTSEVCFEGCRVPGDAVLGRVGSGAMVFSRVMDVERLLLMAPAVGVMERLLERCTAHARERKAGGVPIGRHQSIAHRIADMELALESARLLLYRGAWRKMKRGTSTRESALAKLAVSEAYVASCRSAMQIFGGYGYMVEYEIERELRDALATTIYVGTSEIQRNLIAGLRGLG